MWPYGSGGETGPCIVTGKGDPKEQFKHSRIPGSRFFDMDNIADKSSNLPHMLPSEQSFAAAADCLGIGNNTQVVVYDRSGLFSAARVWWTFKVFGHDKWAPCCAYACLHVLVHWLAHISASCQQLTEQTVFSQLHSGSDKS